MKKTRIRLCIAALLLTAFALWTAALLCVDVQPIGPMGSSVGLAALNGGFHRLTGVHMALYAVTDWLSLIPVALALGFAALGLAQWIRRGSIAKVDRSLLTLGGFYATVAAAYLLFEEAAVNFRPVLIEGRLEASYPSSTTLLVLCIVPTAAMQLHGRIRRAALRRGCVGALTAFAALMVAARLVSGVHWLTDVIGGMLLSGGLVMLYRAGCGETGRQA